jgi:hypothetical protein
VSRTVNLRRCDVKHRNGSDHILRAGQRSITRALPGLALFG